MLVEPKLPGSKGLDAQPGASGLEPQVSRQAWLFWLVNPICFADKVFSVRVTCEPFSLLAD